MLGIGIGELAFMTAVTFLILSPQKISKLAAEKKEQTHKTHLSYEPFCKKIEKKS